LGLPTGLLVNGFHLYIFLTILVSGILFMCPNQLNLWDLTTVCTTHLQFAWTELWWVLFTAKFL
jgi:hypothetical protein